MMNSHVVGKTVLILISWLPQKLADQDLHCFQQFTSGFVPFLKVNTYTCISFMHILDKARSLCITCSLGQVTLSWDKYIMTIYLSFTCHWASINFCYFHTPASHKKILSSVCDQVRLKPPRV